MSIRSFLGRMLIYIPIAFIVFIALVSFGSMWLVTHPQKIISPMTPEQLGWKFERVSFRTKDGVTLKGWFVPSAKDSFAETIIMLHGYPADKGDLLLWSGFLHEEFGLFFFDFRYFGESEGSFTSLGDRERLDLLAAIELVKARGAEAVGLMGFSFGGAVALLTLEQTQDVKAVVTDSAFANLELIGKIYWGNLAVFNKPLTEITQLFARLILDIHPEEIVPEEKVRGVGVPLLIIHSKEDELITVEHAERFRTALKDNPLAEVWILKRGIHGALPQEIQELYEEKILNFFRLHLSSNQN